MRKRQWKNDIFKNFSLSQKYISFCVPRFLKMKTNFMTYKKKWSYITCVSLFPISFDNINNHIFCRSVALRSCINWNEGLYGPQSNLLRPVWFFGDFSSHSRIFHSYKDVTITGEDIGH